MASISSASARHPRGSICGGPRERLFYPHKCRASRADAARMETPIRAGHSFSGSTPFHLTPRERRE